MEGLICSMKSVLEGPGKILREVHMLLEFFQGSTKRRLYLFRDVAAGAVILTEAGGHVFDP